MKPIDCLFVGLLKDYGRAHLDLSHEFLNLWTGLEEHPRLRARAFFPDLVAMRFGLEGMRERFADLAKRDPPALLVHQPFTPELDVGLPAIADLTRRGVATVEFDADTSWRFDGFIRPRIPGYALYVTTHPGSVERYRAAGARVHLSQWAVGSWYRGYAPERPRPLDVTFVGRTHGGRPGVVRALRRRGVRVDCFGPGWERRSDLVSRLFRRGKNHGYGTFLEVRDTLAKSVVSLNLANASQHGADQQIKGRHFEIPALGACQVTTPAAGIERYFEPGREIVVADEGPALAEAIRGLLLDRPRARAIAEAGWARTWAEHTWERRIDGILEAAGLSG